MLTVLHGRRGCIRMIENTGHSVVIQWSYGCHSLLAYRMAGSDNRVTTFDNV